VRVVILGEGNDELGPKWRSRRPYYPVRENLGSLEIIVKRLCQLSNQQIDIVHFVLARNVKLWDVLCNVQLLRQTLQVCYPSTCRIQGVPPAAAAIIVWDASPVGQAEAVASAVSQVRLNFPALLVRATLDSMLECALAEKSAIEQATHLAPCSIQSDIRDVVRSASNPKRAFEDALYHGGYSGPVDSGTKARIASRLSENFLRNASALKNLRDSLLELT